MAISTHLTDSCTVAEYNRRLSQTLGGRMQYRKYKILKAVLVTGLIVGFAAYAIDSGADPTTTAWFAFAGILVVNGVEAGELLSVGSTTPNPKSRDTSQDDD